MEVVLFTTLGLVILLMVLGVIKPKYVREELARDTELNPYLKPRVLPFDRNLAAVGVLEPEFVEVPDLEAWRVKVQELEAENYEPILEMGSELPVAYMGQTATPEYVEPPTKMELRWRNTLAEEPKATSHYGKNFEFKVKPAPRY